MIHLLIPPGPVMVDIMTPVVDPGRDGFFPEQKIQVTGIINGFIFPGALPHTYNDLTATVQIQIPRIVHAGQIAQGRVDKTGNSFNHSHTLIIKIAAPGTRKNDKRFPPMSVDLQGSGFKGYNTLILNVFQHAARADRFHPLGGTALPPLWIRNFFKMRWLGLFNREP